MKTIKYKIRYKEIILKVCEPGDEKFDACEKVFNYCRKLFNPMNEEFRVFILDGKNRTIEAYRSEGTTNENVVYPGAIMKKVLMLNGVNIIIAHNHPSGDCSPSAADITMTKKIQEAGLLVGITLIDHVIYTENSYFSFVQEKII